MGDQGGFDYAGAHCLNVWPKNDERLRYDGNRRKVAHAPLHPTRRSERLECCSIRRPVHESQDNPTTRDW